MPHARIRRYLRHGMLPQLAVFEASVRLGSFTSAADELGVAQPTVSTQIRKLTDAIGQPLFEQVGKLGLDAEAKAFVFDALAKPADIDDIVGAAQSQEQAAELYLASRLAIDPDHAAEKAWLEALAHRLKLPADLVAHLERQATAALPAPVA